MQRYLALTALIALALGISPSLAKQKFKTVYSFGATQWNSRYPSSGLISDSAGNVYGTAYAGGNFQQGTVFVWSSAGVETDIYSFSSMVGDGIYPKAGVALDKNGNLFGTTTSGGATGYGTIYELTPTDGSYTAKVLYSFCSLANCADGSATNASLSVGANGDLYGTTPNGGLGAAGQDNGIIFRLRPPRGQQTSWTETVLHAFCSQPACSDGANPNGAPLLAKDGFLYGTASGGGQGGGVIYRVKPSGADFQVMHAFLNDGEDGFYPLTSLAVDKENVLYGTTALGGTGTGSDGLGTVFSYDPKSSTYSKIYDFHGSDGEGPQSGLTIVETKKTKIFYGTLSGAGGPGYGAVYSLSPPAKQSDPWTAQVLHAFCSKKNCKDGLDPFEDKLANVGGAIYGTAGGGGIYGDGVIFRARN